MANGHRSKKYRKASEHSFAKIPSANIPRSQFNRSFNVKTAFNVGDLVPFMNDEALPGDTHTLNMTAFARQSTPAYPTMHDQWLDFFFFAVPIRLLWTNWEKLNGAQDDPGDSVDFTVPIITSPATTGHTEDELFDHLGIPPKVPDLEHSALYSRAYAMIWRDWFRDENLQDSPVVDTDDGPDDPADYATLRKRGKRRDYFTSGLPWPQKGDAVTLPLGTSAPVTIDDTSRFAVAGVSGVHPSFDIDGSTDLGLIEGDVGEVDWESTPSAGSTSPAEWNVTGLDTAVTGATGSADLTSAISATINQLRESFGLQKLFERDARGGTRYTEILRSHFGVVSPDARLQRPEYLGGGSAVISTTPVHSTIGSTLGELGGVALGVGSNIGFTKSFTEHCIIIGLVASRATLSYQQGLDRRFSRESKVDHYWPALSHLGEQSILNKEIYAQGIAADDSVFAYQERWSEYRYKSSEVHGPMRSTHTTPLDQWHLVQEFSALPVLNDSFIQENPPMDRILLTSGEVQFLMDCDCRYTSARPMPTYSVPGMIDRF